MPEFHFAFGIRPRLRRRTTDGPGFRFQFMNRPRFVFLATPAPPKFLPLMAAVLCADGYRDFFPPLAGVLRMGRSLPQ
jgi:hypothetical protein